MDTFALSSLTRANTAMANGLFDAEITPVTVTGRHQDQLISKDQGPINAKPEKIPTLRPAFIKDGSVTAANSSSISDGAVALIVMSEQEALRQGFTRLAKIIGHATHAIAPENFTLAPIGAIEKLLIKFNLKKNDIDFLEINEAFAMVTMLTISKLQLDDKKVNVNGGACALGHPIGASGARMLVTLLHTMINHDDMSSRIKNVRGIATLCIDGGEDCVLASELPWEHLCIEYLLV
ncbi:MAG: acetyl-CoA C-acetyltransferase [Lentisphaeria bacterium]|jgi:acetyl-CoA C-acetyltransferase